MNGTNDFRRVPGRDALWRMPWRRGPSAEPERRAQHTAAAASLLASRASSHRFGARAALSPAAAPSIFCVGHAPIVYVVRLRVLEVNLSFKCLSANQKKRHVPRVCVGETARHVARCCVLRARRGRDHTNTRDTNTRRAPDRRLPRFFLGRHLARSRRGQSTERPSLKSTQCSSCACLRSRSVRQRSRRCRCRPPPRVVRCSHVSPQRLLLRLHLLPQML